MRSIYSIRVLQRILDRWGVGKIEDVTYFGNIGRNIWRHSIETTQGNFELYSYPETEKETAELKLTAYLQEKQNRDPAIFDRWERVHSFDRCHALFQYTKKHQINCNQAAKDLTLLLGSRVCKAFRVYGSILQIHLNDPDVTKADVLSTYAWWSIQEKRRGIATVLVDSRRNDYSKLDETIALLVRDTPTIKKYILAGNWFELYLSNGMSLHFLKLGKFPAIELHLHSRKHELVIFEEKKLQYTKSYRGE